MKKLLAVLLCVCLCLCVGCNGSDVQPQSNNLEFSFEFSNANENFKIDAEIDSYGEISFTVAEPESIRDLRVSFSGDTVKTEFLGVKKDFPLSSTDFGVLSRIYKAFSGLGNSEVTMQGDEYKATVTADGEEYIFTLTDLGLPISIELADSNTVIELKNISAN